MSKHDWISACRADSTLIKMVTADIFDRDTETAVRAGMMILIGQTVPVDMLPNVIWYDYSGPNYFLSFFNGDGYWIVSRKAADIYSRFDLADGGLYPVQILKKDRKIPVEGEFVSLNVGAQKSAFLPEKSPLTIKRNPGLPERTLSSKDKDGAASVSNAALEGPDLWWDRRINSGFFLIGALGDSLNKAGMAKAFRLYRCPVVEV